jgi:hypothetical protein
MEQSYMKSEATIATTHIRREIFGRQRQLQTTTEIEAYFFTNNIFFQE